MRLSFLLCLVATLTQSCSSLKITQPEVSNCPSAGNCNIEIFDDHQFELRRDEFGKSYVEDINMEGARQLKISFLRKADPSIADSQYIEELYLPLKHIENQINEGLENFKMDVIYGSIGNNRGQDLYHSKENVPVRIRKQDGKTYLNLSLDQPELQMNELTVFMYD